GKPASTMLSAEPETTATTTYEIPRTLTQGNSGKTLSTQVRNNQRTKRPAIIGMRTIWTIDMAIEPASTGSNVPANHKVSNGVKIGANNEETDVIVNKRAT